MWVEQPPPLHLLTEPFLLLSVTYCRATCDWLCSALCSADMDVGCYHAGKDAQRRRKTQQDWCTGAIDIVVATVAFGMGIDRADVRWAAVPCGPVRMCSVPDEAKRSQ